MEFRKATDEVLPDENSSWVLRISYSRSNYWATYVVDLSLMTFFFLWDLEKMNLGTFAAVALFAAGVLAWTLTEYCFHRFVYHEGLALARAGHEKHHNEPLSYIAMPFFVTPMLFLPPQQFLTRYFGLPGFSSVLAGFFFGYTAYSYMHHSLHHYKLRWAWFRHLQSWHRVHHAIPDKNFGVTQRFWDRVFGTDFRKPPRGEAQA